MSKTITTLVALFLVNSNIVFSVNDHNNYRFGDHNGYDFACGAVERAGVDEFDFTRLCLSNHAALIETGGENESLYLVKIDEVNTTENFWRLSLTPARRNTRLGRDNVEDLQPFTVYVYGDTSATSEIRLALLTQHGSWVLIHGTPLENDSSTSPTRRIRSFSARRAAIPFR